MKKRPTLNKELDSVLNSLKRIRTTIGEEKLLKSAHRLLSLQLKSLKKSMGKPLKSKGIIYFDSRILPLPEGIRPASVESTRLKYQIGNSQLLISLYPISSERFEIIGQLIEIASNKVLEVILKKGASKTAVRTNEFQIFRFENVQRDSYELEICDKKTVIARVELNL